MHLIFIFWLLTSFSLHAFDNAPVSYQGRFMPIDSYNRQWLYQEALTSESPHAPSFWDALTADLKKGNSPEKDYLAKYEQLKSLGLPSKEMALQLEHAYPLAHRLLSFGDLFKVLPGKYKRGEWYSLLSMEMKTYNPKTGNLELANNFTLYPDPLFQEVRSVYFKLKKALLNDLPEKETLKEELYTLLAEGYAPLAGSIYQEAIGKSLSYPSLLQLKAESFYANYPLLLFCIAGYGFIFCLYVIGYLLNQQLLCKLAAPLLVAVFIFHSLLIALRCYILERPPVSNMLETVLYVPWITVFTALFFRSWLIHAAASLAAFILLILLQFHFSASSFENVQAVLDSQYWLATHVLMVVGSYGLFLLSSFLGHLYLIGCAYRQKETDALKLLAKRMLQALYIGVFLLVSGTLLGGVWAAQSWGRFWDWDPKESWAFISICTYLLCIHAYHFGKIGRFGLSIGSIIGFLSISFTWYGVNYILGTGLHSYGFGRGSSTFYYSYIIGELVILAAIFQLSSYRVSKKVDKKKPTC